MDKLTQAAVKARLREVGVRFKKTEWGDYVVNVGDREATAYHTDDLQDALDTGLAMAPTDRRHGNG